MTHEDARPALGPGAVRPGSAEAPETRPASFDAGSGMKRLKKLQSPERFDKARFSRPLYNGM